MSRENRERDALEAEGAGHDSRGPETPRSTTRTRRRLLVGVILVLILAVLASCRSVRYVSQSLTGGAKILLAREPIERLLAEPDLDPELRQRLELVAEAREFASQQLLLPVGKSYSSYAETGRNYVTWNVVAAPEHSVIPVTWCFPIAGCVSYRGYFKQKRAEKYADRLRQEGLDVAVSGVVAYSTLGWFADPVLDTFVRFPEMHLVGLLLHELAHRRLYVQDDTAFNESFASHVALIGERMYVEQHADGERLADQARIAHKRADQFLDIVLSTQRCLRELYSSDRPTAALEAGKEREFEAMGERYRSLRESWTADGEVGPVYDYWFDRDLNNAHVAAVGDYSIWLDAFAELERRSKGLEDFYQRVEALAELDYDERQSRLRALAPQRVRVDEGQCASAL